MPSSTSFEKLLEEEGQLFFTNVGYSMYPLIRPREDVLHIVKTDSFQKGDVALYKDAQGKYILHRILKIKKGMVTLAGDYNPFKDKKIPESCLLGILVDVTKKDGTKTILKEESKARRFFYTNCFYLKAFGQNIARLLHLRKIK
ncbi:MAG: hypothetical protein J6038_00015 [Bacilli bacterium]|nr:hypothetical protein [Bacilli bacterium]